MSRLFKYQGFEEIRGADAGRVEQKARLTVPPFTTKGILSIEGKCLQRPAHDGSLDDQTWPDLVFKLNRKTLGKTYLGNAGAFQQSFDISHARGEKGLELELSFDFDRMWKIFSMACRLNSNYRRRRRRMLKSMGHDVHIYRILLDDRVLADFTHGASTFLPTFSLKELGMGMNIVGFFQHEFGIGESARCCANSAKAASIPMVMNLAKIGTQSNAGAVPWAESYQVENPYPVNVFHLDPPQMKFVGKSLGAKFTQGRYNIGFWHWELPEYPDYSLSNLEYVDEVWAPSEFVRQSIAEKATVPVLIMPHSIEFKVPAAFTRAHLGLPERDFLFLLMYDLNSSQNRKNPQAAIQAFREAFPNPRGVKLVVKIHSADKNPEDFHALQASLADTPDIILINRMLDRDELRALQNLCDCFVSLHRSEGFGLGLAECMYLGKPVIGTNWSGNLVFMNADNACMVDYQLVEVKETSGPYKKGQKWADADPRHAAWWMKKIVEDSGFRAQIALKGQARIRNDFSCLKIGGLYEKRLRALSCWV
jgi:glycosyltransferase involved in cell wall biosynthesis